MIVFSADQPLMERLRLSDLKFAADAVNGVEDIASVKEWFKLASQK